MKHKASILFLMLLYFPALAQQHTISLTSGWNYSPNSWERYIEGHTYGIDYTWEWQGVHTDGSRAPFLMGLKANMAYLPNGIAGNRYGVSAFATTPFVLVNRLLKPGDLSLQIGGGFGVYPKPWSRTRDELNNFIGSYLNAVIDVGLVSFRAGAGYHLYQSFPDGKIFERVGAFYHFGQKAHQFAGISIKANILHADFIEWSYGVDLW